MGELSFLLEILLNHKLGKPTKDLIAARIRELEERTAPPIMQPNVLIRPQTNNSIAARIKELEIPIDPAQQNSAVQQALTQRQAAMTGGATGGSIFKVKPNPAPK